MLVLSRKIDEDVIVRIPGIPNPLVIRVLDIRGSKKVRLGFTAPSPDTVIDRKEVDDEKQARDAAAFAGLEGASS